REAGERSLQGARADLLAQGRGRQTDRAPVDVRSLSIVQPGRHRQRPLPGPQGEGQHPPGDRRQDAEAGPGARPQRGIERRRGRGYEIQGDVVILKEVLDFERAVVTMRADEDRVGVIADPLRSALLKTGDHILMDAKSGYLLEKLPKSEVEDLALEEVPDIGYDDIGGLGTQIEAIKDAVQLPYPYADYYKQHKLTPPKGVL